MKLCFVTCIAFLSFPAFAQQVLFKNYTVAEGLCSNTVWAINQDDQGFMWFGTKSGLNRFDGYDFRAFQQKNGDPASIGDNFIKVIQRGDQNYFWIGTEDGVYLFNIRTERFRRFERVPSCRVTDIFKDSKGNIWIATRKGLYCYSKKENSFTDYSGKVSVRDIRAIEEDDGGRIWIGTYGGGIDIYNPDKSRFKNYRSGEKKGMLTSDFVLSLFKSKEGIIWIGTLSGGLNFYDTSVKKFGHYLHRDDQNSLSDNIVRAVNQRKVGEILIGTEKGLNILDLKTQTFRAYKNSSNDPFSLSDNAVWSIFVDKQKNIWIGTYFGGVNYVNMKKGKFDYYYPSPDSGSLKGKAVSSFLQDGSGVWVGTEDGGLNYFDTKRKKFLQYPFKKHHQPLSYHNIHSLFRNDDGKLWIGTFTGGLNILDPATGLVEKYVNVPGDETSLSNNSIYVIFKDSKKNIWVGTVVGLNIYDPERKIFNKVTDLGLGSSVIYDIVEDRKGNLWVGTYGNGLFKKDASSNIWQQYKSGSTRSGLSGDRIISLLEDSKGRLWAGTDGFGLNLLKEDRVEHFNEENGFPLKTIYAILEDDNQNLWISSNQGLFCFNPDTGTEIAFKNWDYLQSRQFNYSAAMLASDGSMYFGGINGFNTFHPDSILNYHDSNDYALLLTDFQLFNNNVPIDPNGMLTQAINYTKEITLRHDQSMISFNYAGVDYISPDALEYAYKMEGFDTKWNDVGQQRRATYTNLPPGNFTFRIKARNTKGAQAEKEAAISLTILPPFYLTRAAYAIYFLVAIVLFLLIRKNAVRRAEKRNRLHLEKLKRKEEHLFYKRKIEFFTEMAHEIRTPLSLIIAPLEKLIYSNKANKETSEQLEIMVKNSDRLQSLVNHLLDFRRIESEEYAIKPERVELINLVGNIYARFSSISSQKQIKFSFSTDIDRLEVEVDVEAFTKIISNLLSNAFKFARGKVAIEISRTLANNENYFLVCVTDDGIGVPKNDINLIFNKFFKVKSGNHQYNNLGGTGIGLSLARSLTEMHEGELMVESDESSFTKFTVKIPYMLNGSEQERPSGEAEIIEEDEDNNNAPKLLIVEDDRELLSFLKNSFRENGFRVYQAPDGREALDILKQKELDVVLTDLMMPEMNGMDLCHNIKHNIHLSQIPVVVLTAKSNPDAEMEAWEIGADAYISKPFKFRHVLLVIKNLLKSREQLKAKFAQQPLSDASSITYNKRDEVFIDKLIKLIQENISNSNYSIELLSESIGISRSGLHKKLKGIAGIGANEFIRLIRLKHAAQLLREGNHNISEVGYLSGFSSPSYFSKCFHEQFRKTPKEFIAGDMSGTLR